MTNFHLEIIASAGTQRIMALVSVNVFSGRNKLIAHVSGSVQPIAMMVEQHGSWDAFDMAGKQLDLRELELLYPVSESLQAELQHL